MFRVLIPYVDFFRVLFFLWKRTLSPFWGTEKKRDHKIVTTCERERRIKQRARDSRDKKKKKERRKKIFVFYIYIRTR